MTSIFTPNPAASKFVPPSPAPPVARTTSATTPTLDLVKPIVGGDADAWGQMINDNWDKIDANAAAVSAGIANATFPAGTRALFQQDTAPTGWTRDVSQFVGNKALRLTNGAVGSGGSIGFTSAFASRGLTGGVTDAVATGGTVGDTALSWAQMPPHAHNYSDMGGTPGNAGATTLQYGNGGSTFKFQYHASVTDTQGQGAGHSHPFYGSSHAHSVIGNIDMSVAYVDVIIAVKN